MAGSSSTSYQYDLTSGQDAAHKMGLEKSALQAQQMSALYGGDVQGLLGSANRIRDMQQYLRAAGADPQGIEVIPRKRLAQVSTSATNQWSDPKES